MKNLLLAASIMLLLPLVMFPQETEEPTAVLEYFGDEYEIQVLDIDGNRMEEIFYGMDLMPGDRIKTGRTAAEIRLDPNGSIIRLSSNTEFVIESLQKDEQSANEFTLFGGKLRAIAAKFGLFKRNNYSIQTPSAVAGIRGTDFGLEVIPSASDSAFVFEGEIDYTSLTSGESLRLGAGQFADALAPSFEALALSTENFAALYRDLQFEALVPAEVPGYQPPAVETGSDSEPAAEPEPEPEISEPAEESAFMRYLSEHLGMEIGTVTIDGLTFSKFILQPAFNIGDFKLGLYLPIIYNTDLFDPEDWYKPDDNYEWSFGTDQDNGSDAARDALKDLVLKIRYIEYGDNRDPFFLKAGNVNNVTLGHGIIMNRFANDTDFPAIRRVGLNTGFNADKWTIESVFNDLAEPEIMGGRIGYRPLGRTLPLGFGISSVTDIAPAADLDDKAGDPLFLHTALDTEFPLMERDNFSLVGFADIGTMLPYYREDYTGTFGTVSAGWQSDFIYDDSEDNLLERLQNYGWASGIFGNLSILNYRLEYQYNKGLFAHGFYGPTYERQREQFARDLGELIPLSSSLQEVTRGIYGQAGFELENLLMLEAGYRWAWDDEGFDDTADLFHLMATVPRIPFIPVSASLGMDTVGFVDGIESNSLFDERTALFGELVYSFAPNLQIAAVVTNFVSEDEAGNKEADFAVSIETRVSF
ncbi:FecR family protein [Marispirochaeta aestuarii]|uniref:FecR family protein n=1 Tax=Marispirochaeta aestuarii TaxID=1963862 RepID=UPI0029C79EF3|nr:FecR family protein [Marispirochaeta aestuarii]